MKIRLLGNNILIKPDHDERKGTGIRFVADNPGEYPHRTGEVVQIGTEPVANKVYNGEYAGVEVTLVEETPQASGIAVGSVVVFAGWVGTKFIHEGQEYVILEPKDLIAVLEND